MFTLKNLSAVALSVTIGMGLVCSSLLNLLFRMYSELLSTFRFFRNTQHHQTLIRTRHHRIQDQAQVGFKIIEVRRMRNCISSAST